MKVNRNNKKNAFVMITLTLIPIPSTVSLPDLKLKANVFKSCNVVLFVVFLGASCPPSPHTAPPQTGREDGGSGDHLGVTALNSSVRHTSRAPRRNGGRSYRFALGNDVSKHEKG